MYYHYSLSLWVLYCLHLCIILIQKGWYICAFIVFCVFYCTFSFVLSGIYHMIIWSYDDTIISSYDHTSIWSYDHTMIWSYDHMMVWQHDHTIISSYDHMIICHMFTWPLITWSYDHMWSYGHMITWSTADNAKNINCVCYGNNGKIRKHKLVEMFFYKMASSLAPLFPGDANPWWFQWPQWNQVKPVRPRETKWRQWDPVRPSETS